MKRLLLISFTFAGLSSLMNAAVMNDTDIITDVGGGTVTTGSTGTGTGSGTGTGTGTSTNGNTSGIAEAGSVLLTTMVYPNPTSGDVYISSSISNQLSDLKVFDSSGSLVFESNDKIRKVDMSSFPEGVYYLLAITNNKERHLNKVIKAAE